MAAAAAFAREFEARYGGVRPQWVSAGWQEAARQAHAEFKFLFVYLHAANHQARHGVHPALQGVVEVHTLLHASALSIRVRKGVYGATLSCIMHFRTVSWQSHQDFSQSKQVESFMTVPIKERCISLCMVF